MKRSKPSAIQERPKTQREKRAELQTSQKPREAELKKEQLNFELIPNYP
jgi:hypothetical protein